MENAPRSKRQKVGPYAELLQGAKTTKPPPKQSPVIGKPKSTAQVVVAPRKRKMKLAEVNIGEVVIMRYDEKTWRPAIVTEKNEGQIVLHLFGSYSGPKTLSSGRKGKVWLPAWIDTKDGAQIYVERGLKSYVPLLEAHTSLTNVFANGMTLRGHDKKKGGTDRRRDVFDSLC